MEKLFRMNQQGKSDAEVSVCVVYVRVCVCALSVVSDSLCFVTSWTVVRSSSVRGFLGDNTGMGAISCCRGSSPQGSNLCLQHCRWILYHQRHLGMLITSFLAECFTFHKAFWSTPVHLALMILWQATWHKYSHYSKHVIRSKYMYKEIGPMGLESNPGVFH